MKNKEDFPDLSFTDRILRDREAGKDVGKIKNLAHSIWTFPNGLPLLGTLQKIDEITGKQATTEGIDSDGTKRKFRIYIFKHLETKTYHSLTGASLDRSGLEIGKSYIIDPPVEKTFKSSENGQSRRFKAFGVIDITEKVQAQSAK